MALEYDSYGRCFVINKDHKRIVSHIPISDAIDYVEEGSWREMSSDEAEELLVVINKSAERVKWISDDKEVRGEIVILDYEKKAVKVDNSKTIIPLDEFPESALIPCRNFNTNPLTVDEIQNYLKTLNKRHSKQIYSFELFDDGASQDP